MSSTTSNANSRRSARISAIPSAKKRKLNDDSDDELNSDDDEVVKSKPKKARAPRAPKVVSPSMELGAPLPALTLKNQKDEDVDLSQLVSGEGKKGVVFFLVPKADTPGCTTQACGFRDIYSSFTDTGFDVYGVSADKPPAQEKWQTKKSLPYPLLSDPARSFIAALGAADGNKTKRSHFIFALDQESGQVQLVDKKLPVKPVDSPTLALAFIKTLDATPSAPAIKASNGTANGTALELLVEAPVTEAPVTEAPVAAPVAAPEVVA